jgi:hypothetical protein
LKAKIHRANSPSMPKSPPLTAHCVIKVRFHKAITLLHPHPQLHQWSSKWRKWRGKMLSFRSQHPTPHLSSIMEHMASATKVFSIEPPLHLDCHSPWCISTCHTAMAWAEMMPTLPRINLSRFQTAHFDEYLLVPAGSVTTDHTSCRILLIVCVHDSTHHTAVGMSVARFSRLLWSWIVDRHFSRPMQQVREVARILSRK